MAKTDNSKALTHQKPFRCPAELDIQINRAKGAVMLKTGERISDNQFMINLLQMGLERLREKMNLSFSPEN